VNTYVYTERARARWREGIKRKVYRKRAPKCPVCHGLECLCRPRYSSGMLLTEADLTAEQEYVIKKNRLHNLYLHGWGVVCGLEVLCHPTCDGWVTVKQGYAISPCGDDIVVCEDTDFDVLKAIEECERQQRKHPADCTPRATSQVDCDPDGCWYLTLTYKEDATRALTTLRREPEACPPSCDCAPRGCGCGGRCGCGRASGGYGSGSGGCGCGCGGTSKTATARNGNGRATMTRALPPPACEPTRWCESFRLELCKAPAFEEDRCGCDAVLGDTLLGRIQLCAQEIGRIVELAPSQNEDNVQTLYQACCRFLTAAREYFEEHPTTRCGALDVLATIHCPSPPQGVVSTTGPFVGSGADYRKAVDAIRAQILGLLVQAFVDCLCLQLMPPCPEDPGDERIYLACVTIKDGTIDHICNFHGRKHVWTWPTVLYWLSIAPVIPLMSCLIEKLCCGDYGYAWALPLITRAGRWETLCGDDKLEPLDMLRQFMGAGTGTAGGFTPFNPSIFAMMGGMPNG